MSAPVKPHGADFVAPRCWCGARIYNGHHCENGHIQPRGLERARRKRVRPIFIDVACAIAFIIGMAVVYTAAAGAVL